MLLNLEKNNIDQFGNSVDSLKYKVEVVAL